MVEIKFSSPEESRDWIEKNVTQYDPRYLPDIETLNVLAYFLYKEAISIEELQIPNLPEPSNEQLSRITEPQRYYKYIALELLKLQKVKEEDIKFEFSIYGRRADVYTTSENREILIECCSCYIDKLIDYLEEENTELWIITEGYGPWDKMLPEKERSFCFILRRGKSWNKYYKIYTHISQEQLRKVKNPLDNL